MSEYTQRELNARVELLEALKVLRVIKGGAEQRGLLFSAYTLSSSSIRAIHDKISDVLYEYRAIDGYYNNEVSLGNNNVKLEQATALLYELFYIDEGSKKHCSISSDDSIATIDLVINMIGDTIEEYFQISILNNS